MTHGTRSGYQSAGCHCTPCRAAEARYRAALRLAHAKGQVRLGVLVPAEAAYRPLRALRLEQYSWADLARRLGLRSGRLHRHAGSVRLGTRLRIAALHRRLVGQDEWA